MDQKAEVSLSTKANKTQNLRYKKKPGTAGVGGQLYESKLLSLVLFRALEDKNIIDFHLGANICIGDFDDICFKCTFKDEVTTKVVFIQAKHKEKKSDSSSFNFLSYFDSYTKIKKHFKNHHEDILFDGHWKERDCYLIFYTPSKNIISDGCKIKCSVPWLEKMICTRETTGDKLPEFNIFQVSYFDQMIGLKNARDIELLGKALNGSILKNNEKKYADMFVPHYFDGIVKKYHVVLAQHVINVSTTIQFEQANPNKKFRSATFRKEFFTTKETFWCTLRKKIFDNINNNERRTYESESYTFKLPHIFGNIDLAVSDKERIDWLAENFDKIFKAHDNAKVITLNETFCRDNKINNGFIGLNGGMESLLGNLLVYDGITKMLKFNEEFITRDIIENRNINTEKLFIELQKRAKDKYDLFSFRFDIQLVDFTKLSIDASEAEKQLIRAYLSSLYFFTDQAQENEVEDILKREIENKNKFSKGNQMLLRVHTDAIFLKFHDEVQKWWMSVGEADYLSLTCDFYAKTRNDIIDSPILTILNFVHVHNFNNSLIAFTEDALSFLNFIKDNDVVLVRTNNCFLTAMKIYQYYKNKVQDYAVFIDIEYIVSGVYYNAVLSELENSKIKYFVWIHKNNDYVQYMEKMVKEIKESSSNKINIVITDVDVPEDSLLHQINAQIVKDEKINLVDIDDYDKLTKTSIVMFQGRETPINRILDDRAKYLVSSDLLVKIILKECVTIGKSMETLRYEEVKKYCINRSLIRKKYIRREENIESSYVHYPVNTLHDIDDNVVLIVAEPGMGKSIFLHQVAEKTKDIEDVFGCNSTWIVNINLIDYCEDFKFWKWNWNCNDVNLNCNEVFKFICKAAINTFKSKQIRGNKGIIKNEQFDISGENLNLIPHDVDIVTLFELQLFIHFYKQGNVILLFDGCDEICPKYEFELLRLLYVLIYKLKDRYEEKTTLESSSNVNLSSKNQVKLWVTSRPYKQIKRRLEDKLSVDAYGLVLLSKEQQTLYLKKYLWQNLNLTHANLDEETNFYLYHIAKALQEEDSVNTIDRLFDIVGNVGKLNFENFFMYDCINKDVNRLVYNFNDQLTSILGIPLHLYIAAEYILCQISDDFNLRWHDEIKTTNFFEYFLEMKFKKIRIEEKRQVDLNIPDNEVSYNQEYNDFINKHKKIALCAIFSDEQLENVIISEEELAETHEIISIIEIGEYKTELISNVVDGVPRFIHLLFAEYFAVEYICDCLYNYAPYPNIYYIWYFVLNVVIKESPGGVRTFFDRKIANDKDFYEFIHNESNIEIVFRLLMEQDYSKTSLNVVAEDDCLNILDYFGDSIEENLSPDNLCLFLEFIKPTFVYFTKHKVHVDVFYKIWSCIERVNYDNMIDLSHILDVKPWWDKHK